MQLAQLNIALAKHALDSPELKEFVDNLDHVNGIAGQSQGFVWRLQDESGDATQIKLFDDPNLIVNMSVWQSADDLKNFMFRTQHRDFMRRKGEWFHRLDEESYVLWWIEEGSLPSVHEGLERLMHLRQHGETAHAFTFKTPSAKTRAEKS